MTSDDSTRGDGGRFRPAGVGLYPAMLCIACGKRRSMLGSAMRMYAGVRQRVCSKCKGSSK